MSPLANAHWQPDPKAASVLRRCAMMAALTARGRDRGAIPRRLFLPLVLARRSPPCDAGDDPSILPLLRSYSFHPSPRDTLFGCRPFSGDRASCSCS